MKEQVARSLFWIVWSKGGIQAISFLSTLLVARLLVPSDYGLMALAGAYINIISLVSEMGLGSAVLQFRNISERELNACFWIISAVAIVAYSLLCLATPFIAAWFAAPALGSVLPLVGISLLIVAARVIPDNLLRKRMALDRVSQAEMFGSAAALPVMVGLAWAGYGVWALVAGILLMNFFQTTMIFLFAGWFPGFRVGGIQLWQMLRYSVAALGSKVGWAVYAQADTFVLGKVSGDIVLGFYSMGKQLAALPVNKISITANQILTPLLAEFQSDQIRMKSSFLRVLRLVVCLTFPICLALAVTVDDFVYVALGEKWMSIVPVLQVLALSSLIRSVEVLLPPVLLARYRSHFLFWWTIAVLLLMPVAFWIGAIWRDGVGVAMAWAVIYPIIMAFMAHQAMKELDLSWVQLWKHVHTVILASIGMAIAMFALRFAVPHDDVAHRIGRLLVMCGGGGLVFIAVLAAQKDAVLAEIGEVIGWIFKKSSPAVVVK